MRSALCALALAGAVLAAQAAPIQIAGVQISDTATSQDTTLVLNGAGVRYKAIFKVYVAALYLQDKATTPAEAQAMPGPKRIRITMLRDIEAGELGRLFVRGVEDNMERSELKQLVPGLLRMGQIFADQKKLLAGDTFVIDWLPGRGTLITVKGQPQGEPFVEPEFFHALLGIWLGAQPADRALKEALLGRNL
jgi:hypothetical protein